MQDRATALQEPERVTGLGLQQSSLHEGTLHEGTLLNKLQADRQASQAVLRLTTAKLGRDEESWKDREGQ